MIYTVTFNPSIDYVMFTNQFEVGGLNRAHETNKFPGGKGINVSRVLNTLKLKIQQQVLLEDFLENLLKIN